MKNLEAGTLPRFFGNLNSHREFVLQVVDVSDHQNLIKIVLYRIYHLDKLTEPVLILSAKALVYHQGSELSARTVGRLVSLMKDRRYHVWHTVTTRARVAYRRPARGTARQLRAVPRRPPAARTYQRRPQAAAGATMPTLEFTDRWLRYLKVAERTDFFDAKLPTFGVRASPTGRRSFFVLYTLRGERKKRSPIVSVAPPNARQGPVGRASCGTRRLKT